MNTQIPFDISAVETIIAQRKSLPGAMLPILHGMPESVGYIPSEVVQLIAHELNVSHANPVCRTGLWPGLDRIK